MEGVAKYLNDPKRVISECTDTVLVNASRGSVPVPYKRATDASFIAQVAPTVSHMVSLI